MGKNEAGAAAEIARGIFFSRSARVLLSTDAEQSRNSL
jgi:hypothetical protein